MKNVQITQEELNYLKSLEVYANDYAKGLNVESALRLMKRKVLKMNKRVLTSRLKKF